MDDQLTTTILRNITVQENGIVRNEQGNLIARLVDEVSFEDLRGCQHPDCKDTPHDSDCAVHNAPALPVGLCDCGVGRMRQVTSVFMRGFDCLTTGKAVSATLARCASPDIFESFMALETRLKIHQEIVHELYKAVETLGGKSDILCVIGSFGDTMEDKDILIDLKVWNGACIQCRGLNDSREHLDICESCEIQNKMDKLKGGS